MELIKGDSLILKPEYLRPIWRPDRCRQKRMNVYKRYVQFYIGVQGFCPGELRRNPLIKGV
jgi:hypothetical protein